MPTVTGSTWCVSPSGGGFSGCTGTNTSSIQTAINAAALANGNLTHEVVIQAGQTFTNSGKWSLPKKNGANPAGTGWIIVRTSNLAGIAVQKQRIIQATHAAAMPKLSSTGATYLMENDPGAHHYRFIGIEFIKTATYGGGIVIWNGSDPGVFANIPTDIIIDRCIVRHVGDVVKLTLFQVIRGAVIDSVLLLTTPNSGDSNAIWYTNSPGPMKIWNNELLSSGETVFFGAGEYIPNYRAEDVEVRRNLIRGGTGKNLLEWKSGLRVWLAGNIFQDDNGAGQAASLMLTPRPDEGPTTDFTDDILVEYNFFRRVKTPFTWSGRDPDSIHPEVTSTRIAYRQNYANPVDRIQNSWNLGFLGGNGADQTTFDHNTVLNPGGSFWLEFLTFGTPSAPNYAETNFICSNNIAYKDVASLFNEGTYLGTQALAYNIPVGRVFSKNVLVGAVATYTGTDLSQNYFPGSVTLNTDGSLPGGSPYLNAGTDGTDIGANLAYPSEVQNAAGWYSVYSTIRGIGRFGNGVNDFYAYTGQWPVGGTPPAGPSNLRVVP